MAKPRQSTPVNNYELFTDIALLMLATFIFLLVLMLISARFSDQEASPQLRDQIERLNRDLSAANRAEAALRTDLARMVENDPNSQLSHILEAASVGRKDFDLFVKGLQEIPGDTIHLVVDASGSMHGLSSFLVPILRHIIIRANKRLDALTWFVDDRTETYTGTMGEMFDRLMSDAPFVGNTETIGSAFRSAAAQAPRPGAYMLIGDEPSVDKIQYKGIPSPVFTLPLGRSDPKTEAAYQEIAEQTGGKMLMLDFK